MKRKWERIIMLSLSSSLFFLFLFFPSPSLPLSFHSFSLFLHLLRSPFLFIIFLFFASPSLPLSGKREHYVRKTTCNIMKITDRANPLFESSYNIMTQWDICTI
jgi:cellulose synthase/poly-beta-1,6-N-acetylglucosamine synthase-like glycosyltransferase